MSRILSCVGRRDRRALRLAAAVAPVAVAVAILAAACGPVRTSVPPSPATNLFDVAVRGQWLVAVGGTHRQQVAQSRDLGASWSVSSGPTDPFVYVAILDDRVAMAGTACVAPSDADGASGPLPTDCLFRTEDVGVTWTPIGQPYTDPTFSDNLLGWIHSPADATRAAKLLETNDAGASWSELPNPCPTTSPEIAAAQASGPGAGFVLCTAAHSPEEWAFMELRAEGAETLVDATSALIPADHSIQGFAMDSGGSGVLWANELVSVTRDGGHTWSKPTLVGLPTVGELGRGEMVSSGTVYATGKSIGNYSGVFRSTDAGASWSEVHVWPYDWGQ